MQIDESWISSKPTEALAVSALKPTVKRPLLNRLDGIESETRAVPDEIPMILAWISSNDPDTDVGVAFASKEPRSAVSDPIRAKTLSLASHPSITEILKSNTTLATPAGMLKDLAVSV